MRTPRATCDAAARLRTRSAPTGKTPAYQLVEADAAGSGSPLAGNSTHLLPRPQQLHPHQKIWLTFPGTKTTEADKTSRLFPQPAAKAVSTRITQAGFETGILFHAISKLNGVPIQASKAATESRMSSKITKGTALADQSN